MMKHTISILVLVLLLVAPAQGQTPVYTQYHSSLDEGDLLGAQQEVCWFERALATVPSHLTDENEIPLDDDLGADSVQSIVIIEAKASLLQYETTGNIEHLSTACRCLSSGRDQVFRLRVWAIVAALEADTPGTISKFRAHAQIKNPRVTKYNEGYQIELRHMRARTSIDLQPHGGFSDQRVSTEYQLVEDLYISLNNL